MKRFTYRGDQLRELAFPLGGIGAGCVSLEGRGALRDWEIFNRPNKNTILPMTFAALWCRDGNGADDCRVVQGPPQRDFINGGYGVNRNQGDGLPHFREAVFHGSFPFARIDFHQPDHPLHVQLSAFNPFIPLDTDASGMPVACLTYHLANHTAQPVDASLAFNLFNPVGHRIAQHELTTGGTYPLPEGDPAALNRWHEGAHCRGLVMSNEAIGADSPHHGMLALTTDWAHVTSMPHWKRPPAARWFDMMHTFWDAFSATGQLPVNDDNAPGVNAPGSIALHVKLTPGESVDLPVLISWCFPNALRYWQQRVGHDEMIEAGETWVNPYAQRWPSAWRAADDFFAQRASLTRRTQTFERCLFDSTLPDEALETISATASILHSPTCVRDEDGTLWAWEGCNTTRGCCPGSCTHVWNYALTQAYLFPELHRTMRRAEYEYGFPEDEAGEQGATAFRLPLPLATVPRLPSGRAAIDGQLGGVIQLYRDWRICGDDAYLRDMWPAAKRALEYAWVEWDADRDGLVEGVQHNTYDIEFDGPNPLAQFMYLGALRAGEAMARHLGDDASADQYQKLCESGRAKTESDLFNGAYFEQTTDCLADDAPRYQHGKGCLSDQLLGQLAAKVAGLGDLVESKHVRAALRAIFAHNFRDPLGQHANPQRIYAVGDEAGLLLCSWPRGDRPPLPFVYSDEVWTGIEYQVATHLIYAGMVDQGLRIVRGVRGRYDGRRRNPFNEFECGSHYARAMSSWGLLLALTGFHYDAVTQILTLTPPEAVGSHVRSVFTTGHAWGRFEYDANDAALHVHVAEGELPLQRIATPAGEWSATRPTVVRAGESTPFALT